MNKFYRACKLCGGSGRVDYLDIPEMKESDPSVECGECDGMAIFPTEEGEELLQFLGKVKWLSRKKKL